MKVSIGRAGRGGVFGYGNLEQILKAEIWRAYQVAQIKHAKMVNRYKVAVPFEELSSPARNIGNPNLEDNEANRRAFCLIGPRSASRRLRMWRWPRNILQRKSPLTCRQSAVGIAGDTEASFVKLRPRGVAAK